ncbi:MAG: hypothetical protein WC889_08895 [Myxococcota bacterium]|jgi:hypothetical protein
MNVENAFIRTEDREGLLNQLTARLKAPGDPKGVQPDWGLPSSYDALLAGERKRKIVVSPVQNGWVAIIESKEVIDFTLLQSTGDKLNTDIVAIQVSDVVGACGYALYRNGVVQDKFFSEEDEDPLASVRIYLKKCGIPFDVLTFREAVQLRSSGWTVL